jgi:hypothetical protein
MSNAVERAREALESVSDLTPLRYNEVTDGVIETEVLASFRNRNGRPFLMPHPESQSILTGDRRVFDFIVNAPQIIADLLEIADSAPQTTNKRANSSENG